MASAKKGKKGKVTEREAEQRRDVCVCKWGYYYCFLDSPLRLASHSVRVLKGNSLWHPTPQRHSRLPVASEAVTRHPRANSESVQQSLKSLMSKDTQRRKNAVDEDCRDMIFANSPTAVAGQRDKRLLLHDGQPAKLPWWQRSQWLFLQPTVHLFYSSAWLACLLFPIFDWVQAFWPTDGSLKIHYETGNSPEIMFVFEFLFWAR